MSPASSGRFVWYDLVTTDVAAALDFYRPVVGWGTQPWAVGDQPYTMWTRPEDAEPIGGVAELPQEARAAATPPHWLAYVSVEDVDRATKNAEVTGGTILEPPADIPEVGRFSVIADPQGAVLALFTPASGSPASSEPPRPGDFSWHELATPERDRAFSFYSELFGWRETGVTEVPELGPYRMFGLGDETYGGIFEKSLPGPPAWLFYAKVPDVGQAVGRVETAGGTVLSGPMEVPGGDIVAQCVDPQGAVFALHASAGGA